MKNRTFAKIEGNWTSSVTRRRSRVFETGGLGDC